MTVVTAKLLDVSNHDRPTFDAACLKANGVSKIILGCQIVTAAQDMAEKAIAAGIGIIGTYVFLKDPGQPNIAQGVWRGITICQQYGIKRLWLDCEQVGLTAGEIANARSQVEAAGLLPGIYTGAYIWPTYGTGTTHSDLPLWHAAYGTNNPNHPTEPVTSVNYGGWTRPDIHQYSSTIAVCGRVRDHNYLYDWAQDAQGGDMGETEDILLALFSGSEEAGLDRATRLTNARYRMGLITNPPENPDGPTQSFTERMKASSGGVPPHVHTLDGSSTGGVSR